MAFPLFTERVQVFPFPAHELEQAAQAEPPDHSGGLTDSERSLISSIRRDSRTGLESTRRAPSSRARSWGAPSGRDVNTSTGIEGYSSCTRG